MTYGNTICRYIDNPESCWWNMRNFTSSISTKFHNTCTMCSNFVWLTGAFILIPLADDVTCITILKESGSWPLYRDRDTMFTLCIRMCLNQIAGIWFEAAIWFQDFGVFTHLFVVRDIPVAISYLMMHFKPYIVSIDYTVKYPSVVFELGDNGASWICFHF